MEIGCQQLILGDSIDALIYAYNRPNSKIIVTGIRDFPYRRIGPRSINKHPFKLRLGPVSVYNGNENYDCKIQQLGPYYAELWALYISFLNHNNQLLFYNLVKQTYVNDGYVDVVLKNTVRPVVHFDELVVYAVDINNVSYLKYEKRKFVKYNIYYVRSLSNRYHYIRNFKVDNYTVDYIALVNKRNIDKKFLYTYSVDIDSESYETFDLLMALEPMFESDTGRKLRHINSHTEPKKRCKIEPQNNIINGEKEIPNIDILLNHKNNQIWIEEE